MNKGVKMGVGNELEKKRHRKTAQPPRKLPQLSNQRCPLRDRHFLCTTFKPQCDNYHPRSLTLVSRDTIHTIQFIPLHILTSVPTLQAYKIPHSSSQTHPVLSKTHIANHLNLPHFILSITIPIPAVQLNVQVIFSEKSPFFDLYHSILQVSKCTVNVFLRG